MKYKGITITKRTDDRYQTVLKLDNKTKTIYGRTKEDCFNNYQDFLKPKKITYSFEDWTKIWYQTYKSNNKDSTNKQIISILNLYAKPLYEKSIEDITSIELQQIINVLQKRTLKQASRLYITLNDIFTKAYNNRIVDFNPMLAVIRPKYESVVKEPVNNNVLEQIKKAVKNTDIENLVLFCLYQGTRIGEALALEYEDIDFVNNKIIINKTNYKEHIGTPKTKKSNRVIPLFERTRELLNIKDNGRIFKINYNTAFKRFKEITREHNLKDITFHTLRHCFVSQCNELGINQKQISEWVGHSSMKITDQVYTHINKDFEEKQVEKLNKLTQKSNT
ncbi:MAG: site-specific integrase [Clostridia bacterium]|nr:site-specific integrase [Clostridia bacterium]